MLIFTRTLEHGVYSVTLPIDCTLSDPGQVTIKRMEVLCTPTTEENIRPVSRTYVKLENDGFRDFFETETQNYATREARTWLSSRYITCDRRPNI